MTGHVHAERMIEYGQDSLKAAEAWRGWQARTSSSPWFGLASSPTWDESCEYRRRPRVVVFNGQELPAPEREAPIYGASYWVPSVTTGNYARVSTWYSSNTDRDWLERGLVHLSREHAEQWGKAIAAAIREATHA